MKVRVSLIALLLLFAMCSMSSPVNAATDSDILLDSLTIQVYLHSNGTTTFFIDATVRNVGTGTIDVLALRIDSLKLSLQSSLVDGLSTSSSLNQLDRYTEVLIPFPSSLESDSSVSIHIQAVANDIQSEALESDDGLYLRRSMIYYFRPQTTIHNFTFIAVLPPHASLSSGFAAPLFPTVDGNYTDGESLIFYWNITSMEPGLEQAFIVKYEIPNTLVTAQVSPVLPSSLFLGIGILLGIGGAFLAPKIFRRIKKRRSVRYVSISDDEQEVVDILRVKGGSCPQKLIVDELGVSQAKASLLLKALEERGIVRRFRDGRANMVHLVED
ncbi:MAG: helix-turn-helix transcriptional regulator [Candidatus Thorarchaeota archaeon]